MPLHQTWSHLPSYIGDYRHGLAKLGPKRSAFIGAPRLGWLIAKALSIIYFGST